MCRPRGPPSPDAVAIGVGERQEAAQGEGEGEATDVALCFAKPSRKTRPSPGEEAARPPPLDLPRPPVDSVLAFNPRDDSGHGTPPRRGWRHRRAEELALAPRMTLPPGT
ncbi:unnamed protein product [Urochloa humidicola]